MTIDATVATKTILELRGCQQTIYSTESLDTLLDRIQIARDAARPDLPPPLVQTQTRLREDDDGIVHAVPCSFDPTLVALIYSVETE